MRIEYVEFRSRLIRIEKRLTDGFRRLEGYSFQRYGVTLSAHDKMLSQWSARIRADKTLRFPHRKILDFLLGEYDSAKDEFNEIHFSRLVKASRVGKNMAKGYLAVLESKGYIDRRTDGYRVFYALRRQ